MTDIDNFTDSLTIPSSTDQVARADELVPEDTIANLAIVVTELVNNAIKHGNKLQKDKKVTVMITYKSGKIEITVKDEGEGFNPDNIADPLAEENLIGNRQGDIHR
jgi:serine/threonine-protein kinase RsbW